MMPQLRKSFLRTIKVQYKNMELSSPEKLGPISLAIDAFDPIVVIDKNIGVVPSAKLLGLTKSNEPKRKITF